MRYFQKKTDKIIDNLVQGTYERIEVKGGDCKYNYKCHMNAVHHATEDGEDKVAMVMYSDRGKNKWWIHFVNVDGKGKFTDNTIGHWASDTDYMLVKYVDKEEFLSIGNTFIAQRSYLKSLIPWYLRIFSYTEF